MDTNLANYAMRPVPENERHFMNDQVFKFVFGKTARKELTIDLLNTFLADELGSLIRDLSFLPQEESAENVADKEARLDGAFWTTAAASISKFKWSISTT